MPRLALLTCAVAMTASLACGSTSSDTAVGPTPVRCGVSVTSTPGPISHRGGTGSVAVAAARECSWSASTQAAWISLTAAEGQGDGTIRFTVAANPAAAVRRGTVTVGGQSAEVSQEAAPCTFEVDRQSLDVPAGASTARVQVQAPAGCAWSATSSVPWITITGGAQGSGSGDVQLAIAANGAPTARTGRLDVAGREVLVRQQAAGAPGPSPGPGDCTVVLDPEGAAAPASLTDGAFAVMAETGCAWTAVSDAGWLTVLGGGSGSGPGQVSYRASENDAASSRTGRITVNGAVFTLTQDGRQAPACDFGIDPTSRSFGASGGTGEIDVNAGGGCAWTALSTVSWIQITSGAAGIGDGTVRYQVSENTGAARSGIIRVAGLDFTVSQAADVVTLRGEVRNLSGSCPSTTFDIRDQRIRTTAATSFRGGNCSGRLRDGVDVRVSGVIGSDGVLTASEVRF